MTFEEQVNAILGGNSNQGQRQENFEAITLGSKRGFLGRILPLEENQFPFVQYERAWLSYTNQDGEGTSVPAIINNSDGSDELAHLVYNVYFFNYAYKQQTGATDDIIKIATGNFGLNIQRRALFLGVEVAKNNQGQYVQETDPTTNQQVVHAYDMSFGMLKQVLELLKPQVPYMFNNQPLFNNDMQFITVGNTIPVQLQTTKSAGRWETHATALQQLVLPKMSFDYLEKDETGEYKFVDNLVKGAQPLKESNPNFYTTLLNQIKQSVDTQMSALGLTSLQTNTPDFHNFVEQYKAQPSQAQQIDSVPDVPNVPTQPQSANQVRPENVTPQAQPEKVTPRVQQPVQDEPDMVDGNDLPFDTDFGDGLNGSQSVDDFLSSIN